MLQASVGGEGKAVLLFAWLTLGQGSEFLIDRRVRSARLDKEWHGDLVSLSVLHDAVKYR